MEVIQSYSLSQIATNALNDLRLYLSVIDSVIFQTPLDLLSGSSIGQHSRHIIEFYNCLLEQSEVSNDPVISYAKRRRDFLIESQPDHAIKCVDEICERLSSIDVLRSCRLDCNEHGQENLFVESTIGRELIYNIEHTIHHLAIVKIALKAILPDLTLPEHFGVAPSTLRHRHEACAQ
jgi:predicted transcriptional regulator